MNRDFRGGGRVCLNFALFVSMYAHVCAEYNDDAALVPVHSGWKETKV